MKVRTCPVCGIRQDSNLMVCGSCSSTEIALAPEKLSPEVPSNPVPGSPEGTRRVSVPSADSIVLELLQNPAIGFDVLDGQVVGRTSEADVVIKGVPDGNAISGRILGYRDEGETLFGDYQVVETIHPHETEKPGLYICNVGSDTVVVKIAALNYPPREDLWRRLPELRHPNVLETIKVDSDDGLFYEVQSFYPKGALSAMPESNCLPGAEWVMQRLIADVNTGLKYLHSHGIVHRDIKPGNLLIGDQDQIVLGDFDISTTLETNQTSRATNRADGTNAYMAPEAFPRFIDETGGKAGATVSRAADYYSLGITALELTLGTTSLHQCGFDELFDFYLSGQVVELPDQPERLATLLRGLLIRNRYRRWTADEVDRWIANANTEEDLRRIADDRGYSFNNKFAPYRIGPLEANSLQTLGEILFKAAADPALAPMAEKDLVGGNQLVTWLTNVDSNVSRLVDADREFWRAQPSVAVHRCAVICAPNSPHPMADGSQLHNASEWLVAVAKQTTADSPALSRYTDPAELLKFSSWLELSTIHDLDLAEKVAAIAKAPEGVRLDEMIYLLDQSMPLSIDRSAWENLRSAPETRSGAPDPKSLVRLCLGSASDWTTAVPTSFARSIQKWQQGLILAWMRQRGLSQLAAAGQAQADANKTTPEYAFEAFLRALDPSFPKPEVLVSLSTLPAGAAAPYGVVETFTLPYTSEGPGIPVGSIALQGALPGVRLVSNLVKGRQGSISIEINTKEVPVTRDPHRADIVATGGNFNLAGGGVPFLYRSLLPTSKTLLRVFTGACLGAGILGGARLLATGVVKEATRGTDLRLGEVWASVTHMNLQDGKWIISGAVMVAALFGGARLWLHLMKHAEV